MGEEDWTLVSRRRKPPPPPPPPLVPAPVHTSDPDLIKIKEPCWFYNNGGCRNKDGSEKSADECKYLHNYSDNVKRPPHLCTKKPCDKYNLEGECKWHDNCKYSHRNLTVDEWSRFYPGIPYTLKTNIERRVQIETKLQDIESRLGIIEFKQEGLIKDVVQMSKTLHELAHFLHSS